jgi:hypothetical protein
LYFYEIEIEKGCYFQINRTERFCKICNDLEIEVNEDENHFLWQCKKYRKEREILFKKVSLYYKKFPHNRGKQIAYIDYCHWRQLYIYIYKKIYINTMFLVGFRALKKINNINRKRKNISVFLVSKLPTFEIVF